MRDTLYNLSNEQYHHGEGYRDYLSSTQLKLYMRSPKYFRYKIDNPEEEKSDALVFGSLFHDLMASIAVFDSDLVQGYERWFDNLAVFQPPINEKTGQFYGATTKAYKEAYDAFLADNADKTIACDEDIKLCREMADAMLNGCGTTSAQIRNLLQWGSPEVSHFVKYDGCKFKYRPDLETKKKIIDFKTVSTNDLSERSINGIISKYAYDVAAAFYLFMEHERSGQWKTFYWCFVSKQPPFDTVLVDASNWTYIYNRSTDIVMPQVGAIKMSRLLDLHIQCVKDNKWPGAEINIPKDDFGRRIMAPTPPQWEVNNASDILEQTVE